jgi:hypothetical protein
LVARTKQGPFPRAGLCCPVPSNGTLNPSDSRCSLLRFRSPLYAVVVVPLTPLHRASSTGLFIFRNMPSLLPRKTSEAVSVLQATEHRPSPHVHWVGAFMITDEATPRFTCVTACCFASWELTTSCYQNAAPVSYRGVRIIPRAGLKPAR